MKNVLITGVTKGIGSACASLFIEKRWNVIGIDISKAKERPLLQFHQVNLNESNEIKNFANTLIKKNIRIDACIFNAAVQCEKGISETTEQEWDQVFNVNVKSVYLMIQNLLPLFNQNSSIVNISSVHAKATSKNLLAYVASKGALSALTRALALELSPQIRVNAILPGAIETDMLNAGLSRSVDPKIAKQSLIDSSPLKKIGLPNDVAQLCYFLSDSELSSNITGQEFVCDGGVLARLASES